ncbi:DUF1254 domain-containing protein [Flavobacterium zhairuonense]|uniref:DUF1254 domain-containing protein n=1 Tax=Flavobacterium zhairuonense TaxID=2493631 RepID=UPI00104DF1C7|nr:DUF1254 domain-containing protein [Flavobacterium zhairuonense]KAF2508654.1 DUF1254 domain-containing protein [Flavobacterium zhairuonense]
MKKKSLQVAVLFLIAIGITISCKKKAEEETSKPEEAAPVAFTTLEIKNTEAGSDFSLVLPKKEKMSPEYAQKLGEFAYVWAWPLVNMLNRRTAITQAPKPAYLNGVLPVAPQGQLAMLNDYITPDETFVTCPNQDVVYGLGFFDLDSQPVVLQVPDFGDRFWVYAMYDHRTNQFGQLGKPYGTKPGFYLLTGPNWKGETPKGITDVVKCPTTLANIIPRVFQNDTKEDKQAIQAAINQIVAYPVAAFDGKKKTVVYKNLPAIKGPASDGKETKWVVPEKFFDENELGKVLEILPPLKGEEELYAQLKELIAAAKSDPAIKEALVKTAQKTEENIIHSFFLWKNNGVAAGNGWNRSFYSADWEGSGSYDYYNRAATAKSNMFDNRPNETQYYYTDNASDKTQLDGKNNYTVTFVKGEEPPVQGFWSLTLYNEHHLFSKNKINRYSLGTKNKGLKKNKDGSLTIYVSSTSPGADKESNWLPSPDGTFSLYIRAYWGKEGVTKGTWTPPAITKI